MADGLRIIFPIHRRASFVRHDIPRARVPACVYARVSACMQQRKAASESFILTVRPVE